MPRKTDPAPAQPAAPEVTPAMVSVTILAEGVRVDGAGNLPVGISVLVTPEMAASLREAGEAE